jgi:hypothetical protein
MQLFAIREAVSYTMCREEDVQRFNAQSDQMQALVQEHKHMSLRLASLEAANKELQTIIK